MNIVINKAACSFALSLIRTLYIETQPNEGHSNQRAVESRWNTLEELVTLMAEQLQPGSSMNVKTLFTDHSGLIDELPF